MERRLAVVERGGLYVAGVFTPQGLYSTCVPRTTEEQAITASDGTGLVPQNQPEDVSVLRLVFEVYDGRHDVDITTIRFDLSDMTEKTRRVLTTLLKIPAGKTVTYGQLASMAGLPHGARFVGNVMARNRLAPLIPCHRVVATDGLGGYSLGLATKKTLLEREQKSAD